MKTTHSGTIRARGSVGRKLVTVASLTTMLAAILTATLMPASAAHAGDPALCEGQGNATLVMKGNCEIGSTLKFKVGGRAGERFKLLTTLGTGPSELPGVGDVCLDLSEGKQVVGNGVFGPAGVRTAYWTLPDDPQSVGQTVAFQAIMTDPDAPGGVAITNAYAFELCPEGSLGDACDPECEEAGISELGVIAPVLLDQTEAFPADIRVRLLDGNGDDTPLDELTFEWSPESPPLFPLSSAAGRVEVSKVTFHADYVVVFVDVHALESNDGRLPGLTVIDTAVGEDSLVRTVVTSCEQPVFVGEKIAPLFVRRVVAADCPADDCPLLLDFETEDDFATPLVNGQDLSTPGEFGVLIAINSGGNNQGAAIFNTDIDGPNDPGADPDLLVGLGNVIILQSNDDPEQSEPGIFDTPNDSARGGWIALDFAFESHLTSIDLIDIDSPRQGAVVAMVDAEGRARVYDVPAGWTGDVASDEGTPGFGTLDLETLEDQPGFESTATATEDDGFDPDRVVRLEVSFEGSGATDNLVFCPTP